MNAGHEKLPISGDANKTLSLLKTSTPMVVVDSWENAESDPEEMDLQKSISLQPPAPPPPTPASPNAKIPSWENQLENVGKAIAGKRSQEENRRPEKSNAAANRMIAGALGLKTPKKSEEEKAYERAIQEQEIKKRNREKEANSKQKVEDDNAKNAVWNS